MIYIKDKLRSADLIQHQGPFLPVCFCVDTSLSMQRTTGGTPTGKYVVINGEVAGQVVTGGVTRLEQVQKALELFCRTVYADEDARGMVEYAVVTFDEETKLLRPFGRTEKMVPGLGELLVGVGPADIPQLHAQGTGTKLGEGVHTALQAIKTCTDRYERLGVPYRRPCLFIIGDGQSGGSPGTFQKIRQKLAEEMALGRLAVHVLAVGKRGDLAMFDLLSPTGKAIRILPQELTALFVRLARESSVMAVQSETVAQSTTQDSGPMTYVRREWTAGLHKTDED